MNIDIIGEKANATRPEIEQIMIANHRGIPLVTFENDLFVIRRRIERRVIEAQIRDFYICSLSARSIIYKGMFLAEQLTSFYPDLLDERFISSFAVYHQRYSTNTFPTWPLAQPFRILAHNGEINTVRGNINWMKSHETRMASEVFGAAMEDVKPIIQVGQSDSASLDNVFEVMIRAGRSVPMVKSMLVPEAWAARASMPACAQGALQLRQFRHGALGRSGGARHDRWLLGAGGDGSQRPPPDALHGDGGRVARGRLGNRHDPRGRDRHHREGPPWSRPDGRRQPGRGQALPRR